MPPTLPDDADVWIDDWRSELADSDEFADAADGFTATFRFVIRPDDSYRGDPVALYLAIEDGAPVDAGVDPDESDFALAGPYGAWKDLLRGDLDVTEAVMGGPFDVEGPTATLLTRREAVAELVRAARATPVEFSV
ncbi:SCP2 sterol-binding domain-containing protein [Halomicrobium salinisoli]|uniref:SCP2 sterol-binding domain-containing protein n=1 Tax=Halomicrobium salinisoli TaxID=2878391 RepID=UPI001CF0078C|nr:SCP2 sterol-binding domain-containing protein [Halomicrobium salinisoli]